MFKEKNKTSSTKKSSEKNKTSPFKSSSEKISEIAVIITGVVKEEMKSKIHTSMSEGISKKEELPNEKRKRTSKITSEKKGFIEMIAETIMEEV